MNQVSIEIPRIYREVTEQASATRVVVHPHVNCAGLQVMTALSLSNASPLRPVALLVPKAKLETAFFQAKAWSECATPKRVGRAWYFDELGLWLSASLTEIPGRIHRVYAADCHLIEDEPILPSGSVAVGAEPFQGHWFRALISRTLPANLIQFNRETIEAIWADAFAVLERRDNFLQAYADRPLEYTNEALGIDLISFQVQALEALLKYQRVSVIAAPGTGKTLAAAVAVLWFGPSHPGSHTITTGPTFEHLKHKLWPEIHARYNGAKVAIPGELDNTQLVMGPDWISYAISTKRPAAFGGTHKRNQLVLFDDAHGVDPAIWKVTEDNLMSGEGSRWFAIGNPICEESHPFYKTTLPGSGWHVIYFSALEHPNVKTGYEVIPGAVSKAKIESLARYGPDSWEYITGALGRFASGHSRALIQRDTLMRQNTSMLEPRLVDRRLKAVLLDAHVGADIADDGIDWNSVTLWLEYETAGKKRLVLADQVRWRGAALMGTVGQLSYQIEVWRKAYGIELPWGNVHIDGIGIGSGVVSRLHELGRPVDKVNFGEGPKNDWDLDIAGSLFLNRRAELYAVLAQLLFDGQASIPERFESTWEDVCAVEWSKTISSSGHRCLIPKEEVKKRLPHGRSPDDGDSAVIGLSRTGGGSIFG